MCRPKYELQCRVAWTYNDISSIFVCFELSWHIFIRIQILQILIKIIWNKSFNNTYIETIDQYNKIDYLDLFVKILLIRYRIRHWWCNLSDGRNTILWGRCLIAKIKVSIKTIIVSVTIRPSDDVSRCKIKLAEVCKVRYKIIRTFVDRIRILSFGPQSSRTWL